MSVYIKQTMAWDARFQGVNFLIPLGHSRVSSSDTRADVTFQTAWRDAVPLNDGQSLVGPGIYPTVLVCSHHIQGMVRTTCRPTTCVSAHIVYTLMWWALHSSPLRYLSSNTLVLHLVLVIRKASQKTYLTSLGLDGCVTLLGSSGYLHPVY